MPEDVDGHVAYAQLLTDVGVFGRNSGGPLGSLCVFVDRIAQAVYAAANVQEVLHVSLLLGEWTRSCVGEVVLERWKSLDGFANLQFGYANFVEALEVEPELRSGSEEVCEAQSGIAGNCALAIDNFGNAACRSILQKKPERRARKRGWQTRGIVTVTLRKVSVQGLPRWRAMAVSNYRAEMTVLNAGRFAGSGVGHVQKRPVD